MYLIIDYDAHADKASSGDWYIISIPISSDILRNKIKEMSFACCCIGELIDLTEF